MELPWSDDQAGDQRLTLPYYRYRYQRSQNMLSTIPPQKPHVEPPHEPQTFFGFLFVTCFSPTFIPFWIFITESLLLHFLCYIFGLFQTFPIWQYLPIIWLSFIGSLFTITFVICILGGTFLVSFNLILNTSTISTLCVHFLNTHSWGRSLLSDFPFLRGIELYGRNLRFKYLHRIHTSKLSTLCVQLLNTHSWRRSLLFYFSFLCEIELFGLIFRCRYLHL